MTWYQNDCSDGNHGVLMHIHTVCSTHCEYCVFNDNLCVKDLQDPAEVWSWADAGGALTAAGASGHCAGAKQKADTQTPAKEKTRGGAFHTDSTESSSFYISLSLIVFVMIFEVFDDAENLKTKVMELAKAMQQAKHVVIYTGAGISTVCILYAITCNPACYSHKNI